MINKESNKEISLNEYKQILIDMLKYLNEICIQNGLKYFVAFGTLIGTIRHNGFIPWDDDIDICMPRQDYMKLISIMEHEKDRYYMLTPYNSKYYYNNFSRLCSKEAMLKLNGVINIDNLGPFIDVIPLDKVTTKEAERQKHYQQVRKLYLLVRYSLPSKYYNTLPMKRKLKMKWNITKRLPGIFWGTQYLKDKRELIIQQYDNEETELFSATFDRMSDRMLIYSSEIEQMEIHSFEDIEVCVPSQYDAILRRTYGDYMTLPPVEQQVSNHHFVPYKKG